MKQNMAALNPKVKKFLEGKRFGKLATVMKDGSPHVTPMWYMLEDGKIFVNTSKNRVKYYNIRRDDRVCFLVDDGYPYVVVFGKGRIAKERDGKKDIEALAIRYHGEEKGRRDARSIYWRQPRVSIEIVPERIVSGL